MRSLIAACKRRTPLLTFCATSLVLAACDKVATSPVLTDPDGARAVMDSVVQSYFEDNPSVLSANGPLGGFITAIAGLQPAVAPAPVLSPGSVRWAVAGTAGGSFSPLRAPAPGYGLLTTSIPTNLVGATCIWNFDTVSPNWADDTSRRGLCGTGNCIRFVLYPLGLDGLPSSQTETGYMDITDGSTLAGGAVQNVDAAILSEIDGQTRLDYAVSGTLSDATLDLDMSGSASDGASSLPFDLTISGSQASYATTYSLTAGGLDFSYLLSVDEVTGFDYSLKFVDGAGGTTEISLGIDSNGMIVSGSRITFNSNTVATISGTSDSFAVTPTSDSGITDAQAASYVSLFGSAQELFFQLGGLFGFAMASTGNSLFLLQALLI